MWNCILFVNLGIRCFATDTVGISVRSVVEHPEAEFIFQVHNKSTRLLLFVFVVFENVDSGLMVVFKTSRAVLQRHEISVLELRAGAIWLFFVSV